MARRVNKLFDLEFDEVSSVDRPANQHGLIAISKSVPTDEEMGVSQMFTESGSPVFHENGDPVFEGELGHGDVVFDADGVDHVYAEPDLAYEYDEDEEFGKSWEDVVLRGMDRGMVATGRMRSAASAGRGKASAALERGRSAARARYVNPAARMEADPSAYTGTRPVRGLRRGLVARDAGLAAAGVGGAGAAGYGGYRMSRHGDVDKAWGDVAGRAKGLAGQARNALRGRYVNPASRLEADASAYTGTRPVPGMRRGLVARDAAIAGGGLGVAGGGAYLIGRNRNVDKSLGDAVLEQLSKAVTEADREAVIAGAMDEVEIAKAEAYAAQEALAIMQDDRITEAFIAKAAEYNLPVAPEVFGPILKAAAEVLDDEELEILDHVLSAASDAIFDEVGYAGGASNSVFDQVHGLAAEMVTKSAGDFTVEQASTAMFAANPQAYDAYMAEQNGW